MLHQWLSFFPFLKPNPSSNKRLNPPSHSPDAILDGTAEAIAPTPRSPAISGIELKQYIDSYHDSTGWYAIGHHSPQQFLRALSNLNEINQTATPNGQRRRRLSAKSVLHTWAILTPQSSQFFVEADENAIPVTLIECHL